MSYAIPPHIPKTLDDYYRLDELLLEKDPMDQAHIYRLLAQTDLYFLISRVLSTAQWPHPENKSLKLFANPWLFERCREVQFGPSALDIWFRGAGKSTIKTFGKVIQTLLQNQNATVAIFSVTKALAEDFLFQIMKELEENTFLQGLFPDIFYEVPRSEAPRWSVMKGIFVRRTANFKDPSISAWGLVDSNYTGKRFTDRFYDDVVNEESVTTAEQIKKATDRWDLSLDTGMPNTKNEYAGTFYQYGDTYHEIARRMFNSTGASIVRLHPCFEIDQQKSTFDQSGLPLKMNYHFDRPVLFTKSFFDSKKKEKSPTIFGAQYLCHPIFVSQKSFDAEWIQHYSEDPREVRKRKMVYLLIDPASERRSRQSSHYVMWAVALGGDQNYYIIDGVWDQLNLTRRTDALFDFVSRWRPYEVRYEKYSMQADIPHIKYVQEQRSFRFSIIEVGGGMAKDDRIERLLPLFQSKRIYFPVNLPYTVQETGETINLTEVFKEREFLTWPDTRQKDMLDALARIEEPDLPLRWPKTTDRWSTDRDAYAEAREKQSRPVGSWMSA